MSWGFAGIFPNFVEVASNDFKQKVDYFDLYIAEFYSSLMRRRKLSFINKKH